MASVAEQLAANINLGVFSKATELKKRLWFTLGCLIVYRLGTYIPLPGIDPAVMAQIFNSQRGGILGMFNMFAGGALARMSIFALGIMPYISASIILQLMTAVSPHVEALKKEGEAGRKKINQYTRYLTVVFDFGRTSEEKRAEDPGLSRKRSLETNNCRCKSAALRSRRLTA